MQSGRYITLSGGEGSGKSSVLERLRQDFPDAVFVREPGGTPVGGRIREILLTTDLRPVAWSELFLFMADRSQLADEVIRPALTKGQMVISDRCWVDTLVYQCYAQLGMGSPDWFFRLLDDTGLPWPSLALWLDVDPGTGLQRRRATTHTNRLDNHALEFHQQVHAGFQRLHEAPGRLQMRRIDANKPFVQVYEAVKTAMMSTS